MHHRGREGRVFSHNDFVESVCESVCRGEVAIGGILDSGTILKQQVSSQGERVVAKRTQNKNFINSYGETSEISRGINRVQVRSSEGKRHVKGF